MQQSTEKPLKVTGGSCEGLLNICMSDFSKLDDQANYLHA